MGSSTPITDSPFLTHDILDRLLNNSSSCQDRINLLSAKIHLYANPSLGKSASGSGIGGGEKRAISQGRNHSESAIETRGADEERKDRSRLMEMETRLQLVRALMGTKVTLGACQDSSGPESSPTAEQVVQAESELRAVMDWCKGAMQGIKRRKKNRARMGAAIPEADQAGILEKAGASVEGGVTAAAVINSEAGALDQVEGDDIEEHEHVWVEQLERIRAEAVDLMIRVELAQGRTERAERLRRQRDEERQKRRTAQEHTS